MKTEEKDLNLNVASSSLKEQAKKIVWTLQGYFQFKGREHAQTGIKMLYELEKIIDNL